MHLALATPTDNPAFLAEPFTADALAADADRIDAQLTLTLDALKRGIHNLPETTTDSAALILSRRIELFARAHAIASATPAEAGQRIRIHGDYHLGQLLRSRTTTSSSTSKANPPAASRTAAPSKSPLKDVAGMLRSFSYAAYSALDPFAQRRPDDAKTSNPGPRSGKTPSPPSSSAPIELTINEANPDLIPQPAQSQLLLNAYLLEKSLYELLYELNNRPTWVHIPLAGILALLQVALSRKSSQCCASHRTYELCDSSSP